MTVGSFFRLIMWQCMCSVLRVFLVEFSLLIKGEVVVNMFVLLELLLCL
jgi:hypothetical protein